MKKISTICNLILITVIYFYACKNIQRSSTESIGNCKSSICMDYTNQPIPGLIRYGLLKKMSHDYSSDSWKRLIQPASNEDNKNGTINQLDALSTWFSLEKIKKYIWYIESTFCKNGGDTSLRLGLRFYYIKYPDIMSKSGRYSDDDLQGVNTKYANHHSLVMVPGFYNESGQLIDFDPRFINSNGKPMLLNDKKAFQDTTYVIALFLLEGEGDNHGGIRPPPPPTETSGILEGAQYPGSFPTTPY
jgi:hypothetical protein